MMIDLIALPFVVLIFAILVISLIRGFRRSAELRARMSPIALDSDHRKPSHAYHDNVWLPLCSSIAGNVVAKLNRPLTPNERRTIWRTRSALVLEVMLKEIQAAAGPDVVADLIHSLPPGMDRPDPTGWCE